MQSVAGNSRVLDTLDTKLRVEAYYQSGSLPPAVEQLESGVWYSQLPDPNVQLEAVPGSSVTTWSIPGVCCTSPHSPAIPSHFPARYSQMAAADGPVGEIPLPTPCWKWTVETFGFRRNWNTS